MCGGGGGGGQSSTIRVDNILLVAAVEFVLERVGLCWVGLCWVVLCCAVLCCVGL